jgi:hypothetical protein
MNITVPALVRKSTVVLAPLLVCGTLVSTYVYWTRPLGAPKPFRGVEFRRIVTAIAAGSIRPDSRGVVVLPPSQASLTSTGRAYVYRGDEGKPLILFPSWVGRERMYQDDSWFSGYLYDAGSSVTRQSGDANGWSTIRPPACVPPWKAADDADVVADPAPVLTLRRLDANWFEIEELPS